MGSRALGNVSTIPGRGYCFVAPISRPDVPETLGLGHRATGRSYPLPSRLVRMVGRDDNVAAITARLMSDRFVSIIGPGGIGKTTVAVSVGHALLPAFGGAVCFVDLGTVRDPLLVPGALAAALGFRVHSHDPIPSIFAALPDERMLIVLDSCEHVIDAAALLAERIFQETLQIHILATSRESLRVEGEHIHRLFPLATPPEQTVALTAAQALAFPAVQLFVSRAAAIDYRFDLSDADAPIVAEICRRLDGIALAIELAAGRVEAFGIRGTASLLGDRMELLWKGRRTALPRHQTLSAALDWSYDLLSEPERGDAAQSVRLHRQFHARCCRGDRCRYRGRSAKSRRNPGAAGREVAGERRCRRVALSIARHDPDLCTGQACGKRRGGCDSPAPCGILS
ncbi:MAG: hypothetical protein WDN69_37905 [Aliidongia sp.]